MTIKRVLDLFASFFGLLITLPLLGFIALSIKIMMGNPLIFRQTRVGRNGKLFTLYKFRSMTSNHNGNSVTVKGESRITPLGNFLRKYKLDELPQLWNILKGDMSFVGPRPEVPEYITKLVGEERLIIGLRPGLTSPASIKYKDEEELVALATDPQIYYNEVIWPDKVKMNIEYCKNRSLLGDMILIIYTLLIPFRKKRNMLQSCGGMIKGED